MDRPHVTFRYTRDFPYPVDATYAWLTDYQDDDPQRAGGEMIQRRDVVRRSATEVELDGELDVMGQKAQGRATVRLFPEERRWIAIIGRGGWEFEYKLTPNGAGGSRLDVAYRMGSRRWTRRAMIRLAKPFVMRRIDKMWDNFAASMARDMAAPAAKLA